MKLSFPDCAFFRSKKARITLIVAVLLTTVLILYSFLPPSPDPDAFFSRSLTTNNIDEQFETFTKTLFCREVSGDSISLHFTLEHPESYGILDAPVTFGTFVSTPELPAVSLENTLAALKRFAPEKLSADNRLTWKILESYLQTDLDCA